MKKLGLIGVLMLSVPLALGGFALAQQAADNERVETLRGAAVDEHVAVEDIFHQNEGRVSRNYRQQPPLVPHKIDQYQIDLAANECLACHDWTNAGERRAPTLSMTHYLDRDGHQLDSVSGTRWFCNQCHVPQVNAPALVENTFEPSN
ncbi:nitrate reductase cytochrome c-type subunit [Roseibium sp. SCPC15]|jgi:cytochrome c-type protein NapB|uniref:nitrate reductase cytochrome c-type subunit n=1 Tax=Roseibium sp. SCP15 TaxID=3141376 RepID=UPI00333BA1E7